MYIRIHLRQLHGHRPGVVNKITTIIARYGINIAYMKLSRKNRGQEAMMILETDDELTGEMIEDCSTVPEIIKAFAIPSIRGRE